MRSGLLRTTRAAQRQAPSLLFCPGLTARPVWDASLFPFTARLRAAAADIEAEFASLLRRGTPNDYNAGNHQLHEGTWLWHSLVAKGCATPLLARCPATAAVLESCDLMIGVPLSFAFFSTLEPGAVIAPHFGASNLRLRVHFPLEVPEAATRHLGQLRPALGMRIAGHVVEWRRHDPIVFDDSFEHEVWNNTEKRRVVLLFDVWHPQLGADEREAIVAMFDEAAAKGWLGKP